jgi:hypothetical protein
LREVALPPLPQPAAMPAAAMTAPKKIPQILKECFIFSLSRDGFCAVPAKDTENPSFGAANFTNA